jgi:hypothetical protein
LKGATANMKRIVILILLIVASECTAAQVSGPGPSPKPTDSKNTYALVIGGINRDPMERRIKDKAVSDLRGLFLNNNAGVSPDRLSVLADSGPSARKESRNSTSENLKDSLRELAAIIRPEDRFVFYYVGQANIVAGKLRFNLPGADSTHEQLAKGIGEIKASSMLIVLDCPGAGLAVRALAGPGRIIIGACTDEQHYSTRFSEYFVPALVDKGGDVDGNGRISLLEAFTSACRGVDDFYRLQSLLTTETPVLEDNADGVPSRQPWRYKQDAKDGLVASKFFLSSK